MLVAEKVMFPLGVALIVKYIDYKIKGRESEPVSIDVTIQVKDNKREKTIHYKGDAKTFKEEFDKIDINKLK